VFRDTEHGGWGSADKNASMALTRKDTSQSAVRGNVPERGGDKTYDHLPGGQCYYSSSEAVISLTNDDEVSTGVRLKSCGGHLFSLFREIWGLFRLRRVLALDRPFTVLHTVEEGA